MSTANERATQVHCLLHWEKHTPNHVYLTQPCGNGVVKTYTWKQVGDEVRRMAAYLQSLNLPPKSNIGLLGRNSAHWIMADLAIWMAGHVTVPLYPTLNGETFTYILEHSDTALLMVGKMDGKADGWKEIAPVLPEGLPIIGMPLSPKLNVPQWDDIIAQTAPLANPELPDPDSMATIVYTSGSTGRPKGVMHSFRTMIVIINGMESIWGFSNKERMLSYLPLAHVAERAAVETTSLYFGFQVFFSEGLDTFQQDLQRAQPTIFFSVPRLWTKFYLGVHEKLPAKKQKILFNIPILGSLVKKKVLKQLGMDQVRAALTGSAPLPPNIIAWYRDLGLELLDVYGMSENFAYSHASKPGEMRVGYVGSVNPGVEHRIAENGEVQVKSPGQMLGYYKMPGKMDEEMTHDGYFMTGDRGEIDERGRLKITGRVKELFKTSKGKYVAPVPIENKLNNHPKVEVVCVTGPSEPQPFGLLMLSLDALKELERGEIDRDTLTREFHSLLEEVNSSLEDHEAMDYVVVVKDQWTMENGFLTPTMKIKRNVIEERYMPNAGHWVTRKQKVIWED
jgi:long-subunit acyl-CoA synthetase (AMP-forming)